MFTPRRRGEESPAQPDISSGVIDLLKVVDAEYIILSASDVVLENSQGILSLGILRDMRIGSQPILNLLRAVRRSGKYEEATLELPRGPLGSGTHDLLVRVTPVGTDGLIAILIFDDSLSALDTETEENILQNIEKDIKSCTSIIITHRESSAKRADFILNLSDLDTTETS